MATYATFKFIDTDGTVTEKTLGVAGQIYSIGFTASSIGFHTDDILHPDNLIHFNGENIKGYVWYVEGGNPTYRAVGSFYDWTDSVGITITVKATTVSDLTDTNWYIPSGWSASAGYGSFTVNYSIESDVFSGSSKALSFGYNLNLTATANVICDKPLNGPAAQDFLLTSSDSFTLTITSGSDVTNTSLVAWLVQNGTQLTIDDLTDTAWYVGEGWSATAGYGRFSVDYRVPELDIRDGIRLCIGYSVDTEATDVTTATANKISLLQSLYEYSSNQSFTLTFTSGTDVKNPALIAWLLKYGTQLKVTDLTNTTWKLNNTVELPLGDMIDYQITFTSNSQQFIVLQMYNWNDKNNGLGENNVRYIGSNSQVDVYAGELGVSTAILNDGCEAYTTISITGGGSYADDTTNPKLIAWLSKWGELEVEEIPTDLTGYTVFVPAGWTAEAGYNYYALTGGIWFSTYYGVLSYNNSYTASIGIGFDSFHTNSANMITVYGDPSSGAGDVRGWYEFDKSKSFTLTITGGNDASNPDLIQWFVDNDATFAPSDLTGWTVTVPSGWSAMAEYGLFDIRGTVQYGNDSDGYTVPMEFSSSGPTLGIGYENDGSFSMFETCVSFKVNAHNIGYYNAYNNSKSFIFSITGGDDVDNPDLIKWLADNKATFEKTGGEEEPEEEPETPSIPTDSISITYNGSVIATLLEGETITLRTNGHTAETDIVIRFGGVSEAETEDELAGTWVFNDTLTGIGYYYYSDKWSYTFNFSSNGTNYTVMANTDYTPEKGTEWLNYGSNRVYDSGWSSSAYKTITITSKLSEVTDGEELLTWLKDNATKQVEPTLISFTIDGTPYYAEEGMTWEQWVESGYNPHQTYNFDGLWYALVHTSNQYYVYNTVTNKFAAKQNLDGLVNEFIIVADGVYATKLYTYGGGSND